MWIIKRITLFTHTHGAQPPPPVRGHLCWWRKFGAWSSSLPPFPSQRDELVLPPPHTHTHTHGDELTASTNPSPPSTPSVTILPPPPQTHTHSPGDELTASGARAAQSGLGGGGEGGLARGLRGRSAPPPTLFPALLLAVKCIGCVGVVEGGTLC